MEGDDPPGKESGKVSCPRQAAEVGDNLAGQTDEPWCWWSRVKE